MTATPWAAIFSISALNSPGIEHDAVADHRRRAAHDPARQQRQLVGLVADDEGVAGIVAALEAHDHVGAAGEPVDDLALALVAPLRADDGDVAHDFCPALESARRSRLAGKPRQKLSGTTWSTPGSGSQLAGDVRRDRIIDRDQSDRFARRPRGGRG